MNGVRGAAPEKTLRPHSVLIGQDAERLRPAANGRRLNVFDRYSSGGVRSHLPSERDGARVSRCGTEREVPRGSSKTEGAPGGYCRALEVASFYPPKITQGAARWGR